VSWRTIGVLAAALALGGCTWTSERPATATRSAVAAAASDSVAAEPVVPMPPRAVLPEADPLSLAEVRIEQVVGVTPAAAGALLAEVPEQLEQDCQVRTSGMVQVRIVAHGSEVATTLRGSSHDAAVDACVLTVVAQNLDDALEPSTSPAEGSPPIESFVTVSW